MYVIVDSEALNKLLNYMANAPLPMGRDQLVQDVLDSARPASVDEEDEVVEESVVR